MDEPLPSFKKPPVVETAISLQFKAVEGLTNAHLGIFWDHHLRKAYPKAVDAQPIIPQMEMFGDQMHRRLRLPGFQVVPVEAAARLQMMSENDQTMVQVQNGRLVFNWRKMKDGEYPRWHHVLPAFEEALDNFRAFLPAHGFKDIEPNQWEVTYVNHLLKAHDWEKPTDWPQLLPGLIGSTENASREMIESLECRYRFALPEARGRLHVELHHAFTSLEQDATEILVLQLTARGGLELDAGRDIAKGMANGHSTIVRKFTELTGPGAHKKWERER